MTAEVVGWDVGGANVKAVLVDRDVPIRVVERAFPLWREPERLPAILSEIADSLGGATPAMAVTMTAELADCFATKRQGVAFVLDAFEDAFPNRQICVYGVDGQFRSVDAARGQPLEVAAANWHAGATVAARTWRDALFVDVGSTTTDIVPIVDGRVAVRGTTDPARLGSGELVYTGAVRTPVSAVVRRVPLRGRRCRVASELFAVTGDVYRWLDKIAPADYTCDTPDGRGRTRMEAAARLARMVCADLEMLTADDVSSIAEHVARTQVAQIAGGMKQVMRRLGTGSPDIAVVAGRGAFLARAAATKVGLEVDDLADALGCAARMAPAAAVAQLLAERVAVGA
jgi:probable H4MPT-linked C1 transfer pathway protein